MLGICAGFVGKTEIGDVILADPAWDWQMGKYTVEAFEIQPDQIPADPSISQKVALLTEDRALADFWQDSRNEKPRSVPRFYAAPMASGSAVLGDAATAPAIKMQHRKVLGVDMEVYGVYSAVRDASAPRPIAFALKGVCDHADQYKSDKYQKFAAEMSARCLELLIDRHEQEMFG